MNATNTLHDQLALAADVIGGKPWGADKGKPRIYMPMRRKDAKVWWDFADDSTSDDLLGGRLVVVIDQCGQAPKWYAGQKRKIGEGFRQHGLALLALMEGGDEALARQIMDSPRCEDLAEDDETAYNEASRHLLNGRVAEARAVLADYLDSDEE